MPTIDWTISVLALLSLVISVTTLYLAHLRGPNISLAAPGKIYPCHGLTTTALQPISKEDQHGHFVLVSRLLIANTGLRPGILFGFRLDPADNAIVTYELDPRPEVMLPMILPPGEGWQTLGSIQITSKSQPWKNYLESKKTITMQAVYCVSTTFWHKKEKTVELNIDLAPLYESVRSAQSAGSPHT